MSPRQTRLTFTQLAMIVRSKEERDESDDDSQAHVSWQSVEDHRAHKANRKKKRKNPTQTQANKYSIPEPTENESNVSTHTTADTALGDLMAIRSMCPCPFCTFPVEIQRFITCHLTNTEFPLLRLVSQCWNRRYRALGPGRGAIGWGSNQTGQLGPIGLVLPYFFPSSSSTNNRGKSPPRTQTARPRASKLMTVQPAPLTPLAAFDWRQIRCGSRHTLGLTREGGVYAWGESGDHTRRFRPTRIRIENPCVQIACGRVSLAVTLAGQVAVWGTDCFRAPEIVKGALEGRRVRQAETMGDRAMACTEDGAVYEWAFAGERGSGECEPRRVRGMLEGEHVIQVACGAAHSLALTAQGAVFAWGSNHHGELGDGTTTDRHIPVELDPAGRVAAFHLQRIAGGSNHTLALTPQGEVFAWGLNGHGQLGNGTTTNRTDPIRVGGLLAGKRVVKIACGWLHSLALTSEGEVYTWGSNDNGQLGDGTTTERHLPVRVGGPLSTAHVVQISSFYDHCLALTDRGGVYTWGRNGKGQLGDGTATDRSIPIQVGGLLVNERVVRVIAGGRHSLALNDQGELFAWGNNGRGRLGDGTTTDRHSPIRVPLPHRITKVAACALHTLALTDQGTLFTWGWNEDGSLGDGTTTNRHSPIQVHGPLARHRVVRIAVGDGHNLALADDGKLFVWGRNGRGQLGDGSTTDRLVPLRLRLPANATPRQIAAGGLRSFVWTE
eukprot:gnl/Trimastix_PCT/2341.p1 GENE.gnl/Trimastix_PCT/2341~~gnl/Trimastix_PCT/2341.p1  ORF type:complete len:723 (-),score=104.11 gnl/Trimastix_PCT/2341:234-2402(-)